MTALITSKSRVKQSIKGLHSGVHSFGVQCLYVLRIKQTDFEMTNHTEGIMRKSPPILAIVCFLIAIIIFVFAEGARRIYSGGFFVFLGVMLLVNARRGAQKF